MCILKIIFWDYNIITACLPSFAFFQTLPYAPPCAPQPESPEELQGQNKRMEDQKSLKVHAWPEDSEVVKAGMFHQKSYCEYKSWVSRSVSFHFNSSCFFPFEHKEQTKHCQQPSLARSACLEQVPHTEPLYLCTYLAATLDTHYALILFGSHACVIVPHFPDIMFNTVDVRHPLSVVPDGRPS